MDICKKLIEFEDELKADMKYLSNDNDLILDSFQDAYIKLHGYGEKRKKFYGTDASIKSLLKFVCKNILIDKLRKIQRDKIDPIDNTYTFIDYNTPEDYLIENEQALDDPYVAKKLNDAFSKMSHEMYMTYKLRQKGIRFKDIAYLTDTSMSTSLGRNRHARIRIENEFKEDK
jgi:DNA-directed RNA polymerase specialized sigma24 family protein